MYNRELAVARTRRWREENSERVQEYRRQYYESNASYYHRRRMAREYGLSPEEYDRMLTGQGYVCAVCGKPETAVVRGKRRRLAVDHDHRTGKVRQLLCTTCNAALGMVDDDPERLAALAEYVKYWGWVDGDGQAI